MHAHACLYVHTYVCITCITPLIAPLFFVLQAQSLHLSFGPRYVQSKFYAYFVALSGAHCFYARRFIRVVGIFVFVQRPFNGLLIFSLRPSKTQTHQLLRHPTTCPIGHAPFRWFDLHKGRMRFHGHVGCPRIWNNQEVRAVQQCVLWICLNGSLRQRFGPEVKCTLTVSHVCVCVRAPTVHK